MGAIIIADALRGYESQAVHCHGTTIILGVIRRYLKVFSRKRNCEQVVRRRLDVATHTTYLVQNCRNSSGNIDGTGENNDSEMVSD